MFTRLSVSSSECATIHLLNLSYFWCLLYLYVFCLYMEIYAVLLLIWFYIRRVVTAWFGLSLFKVRNNTSLSLSFFLLLCPYKLKVFSLVYFYVYDISHSFIHPSLLILRLLPCSSAQLFTFSFQCFFLINIMIHLLFY